MVKEMEEQGVQGIGDRVRLRWLDRGETAVSMYCTREEEYVEWMFHCLIYLKMYFSFDLYLCVYVNIHNVYSNACRSKKREPESPWSWKYWQWWAMWYVNRVHLLDYVVCLVGLYIKYWQGSIYVTDLFMVMMIPSLGVNFVNIHAKANVLLSFPMLWYNALTKRILVEKIFELRGQVHHIRKIKMVGTSNTSHIIFIIKSR